MLQRFRSPRLSAKLRHPAYISAGGPAWNDPPAALKLIAKQSESALITDHRALKGYRAAASDPQIALVLIRGAASLIDRGKLIDWGRRAASYETRRVLLPANALAICLPIGFTRSAIMLYAEPRQAYAKAWTSRDDKAVAQNSIPSARQ